MKKFVTILAIIAAILTTDVHWGIMQSFTWAHMIHQMDSEATLSEKVNSTITGQNPCQHCDALAKEQSEENEDPANQLGSGPLLVPLDGAGYQLTHRSHSIFSLRATDALEPLLVPHRIKHPPRA